MYHKPASELFFDRITKLKFFSKYVENISEFNEVIKKSTNVKVATICILLALTYWFMVSAAAYYTLIAFDVNVLDYLKVLAIYTTSSLLGAISFIPGGIGITEGSIAGLFTLNGIDVSTALILSVIIRVLTLWYTVGVGFVALKFTGGFSFRKEFLLEKEIIFLHTYSISFSFNVTEEGSHIPLSENFRSDFKFSIFILIGR